jgi:hypothetical protein
MWRIHRIAPRPVWRCCRRLATTLPPLAARCARIASGCRQHPRPPARPQAPPPARLGPRFRVWPRPRRRLVFSYSVAVVTAGSGLLLLLLLLILLLLLSLSAPAPALAPAAVRFARRPWRPRRRLQVERRHLLALPGRKPAFLVFKRPARPYKSPTQNRST